MNSATDNRMKTISFLHRLLPRSQRLRGLVALAAVGLLLLAVISCSTVNRQAVALPDVPGANYVGSADCEQCHDEICRDFKTADHARLLAQGKNGLNAGCESCHGPCSLHEDSGGDVKPPFIFTAGRPQPESLERRVSRLKPARAMENACYQCHLDVRGQFNLPSHHPVPEGRMTCIQCHPPHKGIAHAGGSTQLLSQEENCTQCHQVAAGAVRVRARGAARRLHHLPFAARQRQRQAAHRAQREPVFEMPFPAGPTGRGDFDWRR